MGSFEICPAAHEACTRFLPFTLSMLQAWDTLIPWFPEQHCVALSLRSEESGTVPGWAQKLQASGARRFHFQRESESCSPPTSAHFDKVVTFITSTYTMIERGCWGDDITVYVGFFVFVLQAKLQGKKCSMKQLMLDIHQEVRSKDN